VDVNPGAGRGLYGGIAGGVIGMAVGVDDVGDPETRLFVLSVSKAGSIRAQVRVFSSPTR